jgi:hypothetical protein
MPMAPISMRKLKQILRLKYGYLLSHRKIAKSLSVSASIVSIYAIRANFLGITSWPLDEKWSDETIQRASFRTKPKSKGYVIPNWSVVQQ